MSLLHSHNPPTSEVHSLANQLVIQKGKRIVSHQSLFDVTTSLRSNSTRKGGSFWNKTAKHERHVHTPGGDERKQSATHHNNNTTTTPTHELRSKRYSKFLNHPTHPTLEYRLPSNYAKRALLVRSMNHNGGQGTATDPTRQTAALLQETSEPDPPICGTTTELSMLFNYFGYQGPQNRFRAVI